MRTTLNIDEDVLDAARSLARERRESLGVTLTALAREALCRRASVPSNSSSAPLAGRFAILPRRDETITLAHVRDLIGRLGA